MKTVPDYARHNETEICGFFGDYRFLSNFFVAPVFYEGLYYPSSEHAYHAGKTKDKTIREKLTDKNISVGDSKKIGRSILIRDDWEDVKYDIMSAIVFDKFFRHKELRDKLLQTGERYLEETNSWNDQIWGVCNGVGTNWLGKVLMKVRRFWQ